MITQKKSKTPNVKRIKSKATQEPKKELKHNPKIDKKKK
jgi:hypothetical protein